MTSTKTPPAIFTKDVIEPVASHPSFQDDLIQAISDGFVAFEQGDFFAAPIQTLGAPPMAPFGKVEEGDQYAAQTCVKSGYFRNNPFYVIKVASGGYPFENSGLMQVYSQSTGRLEALLLDEGILTELRTAAVGALATKLLGKRQNPRIGVLGTGVQARYQLQCLQCVIKSRSLCVYGRSTEKSKNYVQDVNAFGWEDVICLEQPDDLLRECDVVVCTTSARSPLLGCGIQDEENIRCRLLVCIGADAPGKQEVHERILRRADLLVADHPEQSLERGEFQFVHDIKNEICSLGNLIRTKALHRQGDDDDRLIVFDSSGLALQDCVVSQMVFNALVKQKP